VRSRFAIPLTISLLAAACASEADQTAEEMAEPTAQEYESPAAAIAALASSYEESYNAGDAAGVADFFTDDAVVMSANGAVREDENARVAGIDGFMAAFSPVLDVSPTEQVMVGDWVLDRGSYANTLTLEDGEEATLTGNYMSLSRQTADGLKIHWLAVNLNTPAPIPLPAPEPVEIQPLSDGPLADLMAAYAEGYNTGDAAMVAGLWADDAVAMYAERQLASGRAEIEAVVSDLLAMGSPQLTIVDAETEMIGDGWAVDRGSWEAEATVDGQPMTRTGNYMIVCRQADDGTWSIQWGLSNVASNPAM
jgi:uncharacterized protein (TIGR02246 family)